MKTIPALLGLLFVCLAVAPAWGHGAEGGVENARGIRVSAEYDDGEPMSYAAVRIVGPEGGTPFQKGRTDRNGMFMFLPDKAGKWQIRVKDGMGHQLNLVKEITDDGGGCQTAEPGKVISRKTSLSQGVITGISVIFGLSGLAYGWRVRRSR